MKKLIFSAALVAAILAGCGDSTTESVPATTQNDTASDVTKEESAPVAEESTGEEASAINEVIVDGEKYKITLLEILKKNDEIFGNSIDVVFEVENKLAETIGVQARSVSADGYMVDETIINMSQEVVGGKKAKAVMTISNFDGYEFPELNENLEMTLHVFNYDSFDVIEDIPVNVSF